MGQQSNERVTIGVTIVFYVLGVVTMLPWNFFITADTYWQYKLRNTTLGDGWDAPNATLTNLQVSFMPTLVIISNTVTLVFSFFTTAIVGRTQEFWRILGSLGVSFVAMVIVTILSIVNTDEWQGAFYGITLLMIALLNVGIAILQGSLYGLAGLFPSKCILSLISGQAVAGVVSSLSRIISLLAGEEDPVTSGIIYFSMADVFILISVGSYFYFRKTPLYINIKVELKAHIEETAKTAVNSKKHNWRSYWNTYLKIKWMSFTVGYVLLVTLAVFPAVTVYITSSRPDSVWTDVYFQPTVTFLLFNVFDYLGRELARILQWPGHKGMLLHILSGVRIVFIPLLLLCHGDSKTFPTWFEKDFYYIIINIFFALSNGYYGALAMLYYPRLVTTEERELGGTIMVSVMAIGMVIGSSSSAAFVMLWGPNV